MFCCAVIAIMPYMPVSGLVSTRIRVRTSIIRTRSLVRKIAKSYPAHLAIGEGVIEKVSRGMSAKPFWIVAGSAELIAVVVLVLSEWEMANGSV